jgi:hypothetical protein
MKSTKMVTTVLCPYCEQDYVWDVQLPCDPPYRSCMCFECDSVWTEGQTVCDQQGGTFRALMETLGRTPNWGEIIRIGMMN